MIRIVLTNTNSLESARTIAKVVIQQKQAACVNIIPKIVSIYEWKGELHDDEEFMVLFKTSQEKVDSLMQLIKQNHPYQVPELLSIPIESGDNSYLDWVIQQVNHSK